MIFFVLFICGITSLIDLVRILKNCDKITGVSLGIKGACSEIYEYDYKGKHYYSRGLRPGFRQKARKEYKIWVYRDDPERIESNREVVWIAICVLLIPLTIFGALVWYYFIIS